MQEPKTRQHPYLQSAHRAILPKIADFGLAIDSAESPAIPDCGMIEYAGTI